MSIGVRNRETERYIELGPLVNSSQEVNHYVLENVHIRC